MPHPGHDPEPDFPEPPAQPPVEPADAPVQEPERPRPATATGMDALVIALARRRIALVQ